VICTVDGTTRRGRSITLPARVEPRTVAHAVRQGTATEGGVTVRVHARQPHNVHERVGCLAPGMGLKIRTALAEAARARGWRTHLDSEIRACRERLSDIAVEDVSTTDERERLATASAETERHRERVAEQRGELAARRDHGTDTDAATEQFRDAVRDLSEAETSATAARQTLRRRRTEARAARDRLERRLALEDDLANLRREARGLLVERARDAYERAVTAVPGAPPRPDPFDVGPVTAALAVARVATFDAPVVLACDRFDDAEAASAWLGAPVIRVRRA
jgi:hypothetical protein